MPSCRSALLLSVDDRTERERRNPCVRFAGVGTFFSGWEPGGRLPRGLAVGHTCAAARVELHWRVEGAAMGSGPPPARAPARAGPVRVVPRARRVDLHWDTKGPAFEPVA